MRTLISAAMALSLVLWGCEPADPEPEPTAKEAAEPAYEFPSGTVDAVEQWQAKKDWEAKPRSMPSWYQSSGPWASQPYAGATVSSAGCGLVSAAMAASWLTKDEIDPGALLNAVGDGCTTGGLNDMAKFGAYMAGAYGIASSERYHDPWRAVADVKSGAAVVCSVPGRLGDSVYSGHIVVAYWQDGLRVADPASEGNSSRLWSEDEFCAVNWSYFYTWTKEDL